MQLLLGCGNRREKRIRPSILGNNHSLFGLTEQWVDLKTLDIDKNTKPDFHYDLSDPESPLPRRITENSVTEIHAYDVFEHLGQQGDYKLFFRQFTTYWHVLKPDGLICGVSPDSTNRWAWGDPGHTRVIPPECLVFLSQAEYTKQVGVTPMTDYRSIYRADFDIVLSALSPDQMHWFVLRAIKPSRISI